MLRESEKDLPDDYNPPARLAVAYIAMKNPDVALAASNRALPKVSGPRRVRVLQTRSDIFAAKGDAAASREALEQALACAEAPAGRPALRGPDQGAQEEAGGAGGEAAGDTDAPGGIARLDESVGSADGHDAARRPAAARGTWSATPVRRRSRSRRR